MPDICKATLTFTRGKEKHQARCHKANGHAGRHCGSLKDEEGVDHVMAVWPFFNEKWTAEEVKAKRGGKQ